MLLPFLVAQATATSTLGGIALGVPATQVASAHKDAVAAKTAGGKTWTFKGAGGNVVRVTSDDDGNVAMVDVTFVKGSGTIDLPAAPAFPVGGSTHNDYTNASTFVESDNCAGIAASATCYAYSVGDGSELLLSFGPTGGLHEAIFGDRTLLKSLGLFEAGTSL